MVKLLLKRLWRNLTRKKLKYAALLLFVTVITGITAALVGSGITIIDGRVNHQANECAEDGEFSLLLPMDEEALSSLQNDYGVVIEEHFYFDVQEENKTIRFFKERSSIDKLSLKEGNLPVSFNEVVIDNLYSESSKTVVGSNFEIEGLQMKVVGIGCIPDYVRPLREMSDVSVDLTSFTYVVSNEETYQNLLEEGGYEENFVYAYTFSSITDSEAFYEAVRNLDLDYYSYALSHPLVYKYVREQLKLKGVDLKDEEAVEEALYAMADKATIITPSSENPRMGEDLLYAKLYRNIGMAVGGFLLILLSLIFAFSLRREANEDATQIGSLYALGVSKKTLWSFYLLPSSLVSFLGGALGLAIAYSPLVMNLSLNAFHVAYSFPYYSANIPWYLYLYALLLPALISLLVNFICLSSLFQQSVMSVIQTSENGKAKNNKLIASLPIEKRIKWRMAKRNIPGFSVMFFGFFFSSLLLCLGVNTRVMTSAAETSCKDIPYLYSYTLRYPFQDAKDNRGDRLYSADYNYSVYGEKVTINLLGIPEEHECYSLVRFENENSVIISSSFASKSSLKKGEETTLYRRSDNEAFTFQVSDIVSTGPELAVYIPIEKALELEDEVSGSYNVIVSNEALNIPEEYISSTTTKSSIIDSFATVEATMEPFIIMSMIASILLLFSFLYIIVQGILSGQKRSIALFRVDGYSNKEINQTFFFPTLIINFCLLLISLSLGKALADILCPYFYAKMAIGMDFAYSFSLSITILAGTSFIIALIFFYMARVIKKIDISSFIADENALL